MAGGNVGCAKNETSVTSALHLCRLRDRELASPSISKQVGRLGSSVPRDDHPAHRWDNACERARGSQADQKESKPIKK